MSRATYYSPFVIGLLAAGLYYFNNWTFYAGLSAATLTWQVGGGVLAVALVAQLYMVGAQGAWAAVLPVRGGRSVRGPGAVAAGVLLTLGLSAGIVAAMLFGQSMGTPAWVAAGLTGAALFVAAGVYVWCLPAAVPDFDQAD